MSLADQPVLPVQIPTLAQTFLHSMAQKVFTGLTVGALAPLLTTSDSRTQFASIAVSLTMFGAGLLWTWLRSAIDTRRNVALANAAAPLPAATPGAVVMAPVPNPPLP